MTTSVNTISILTQHNDNNRTGANLQESVLTTSNINVQQFGKLFTCPVQGHIYAQPLYVSNVNIPNQGTHNVVYVATMHNMVYAFDADSPQMSNAPLWKRTLEPSVPLPDVNVGPTYVDAQRVEHPRNPNGQPTYRDIANEVGIVSTPVISLEHKAIYVVAFTKTGNTYAHKLHALDLSTGADLFGGPVTISGSVRGTGYDNVKGIVTFTSNRQLQRPALLLANDTLYIAFAAYGDKDPYHGWVFAYSAATLHQVALFNTTPNGSASGIWQAGQGLSADKDAIYFLTGNGTYADGSAFGDCFVKLRPNNLTVLDWFSPYNNPDLNAKDADVGSSGALLIPNSNLLLGGGKEGKFFLIQRDKMGHYNPAARNSQIVQSFYIIPPDDPKNPLTMAPGHTHHIHGSPVYWNGLKGEWFYVWAENDCLKAYALVNGKFQETPISKCTTTASEDCAGMPGGMVSVSANGNTPGTGIVWASHPYKQDIQADANQHVVQGILRAYDASDLSRELWNSQQKASRDDIGNFAKFSAPTIANGKVYMASFSGYLAVYGLLTPPVSSDSGI